MNEIKKTNTLFSKFTSVMKNQKNIIIFLNNHGIILLNDKKYIQLLFETRLKKKLNLNNPQTFNEKLQWLKLYDHNPQYIPMVDKASAKNHVVKMLRKANIKNPEQYIIPTLGTYKKFQDINFNNLPNQFVLKCTHDSGGIVIVKNKEKFLNDRKSFKEAEKKINRSLKRNYYYSGREWPYKNVKPRILIEKYMEDKETAELRDYKFFCFDGQPKLMFIATDRQNRNEPYFDFFDINYKHLDIKQGHPNNPSIPQKPKKFEEMKKLASILSKKIPHVRIDFYEMNGKIYFGEYTFYHFCGFMPFQPEKWDYKIGQLLDISSINSKKDNDA